MLSLLNPIKLVSSILSGGASITKTIFEKRNRQAQGKQALDNAAAYAERITSDNSATQLNIDQTIQSKLDHSLKDEFVTFIIYAPLTIAVLGAFVVLILSIISVVSGQLSITEFTQQIILLQNIITGSIKALPSEFFELMLYVTLAAIGMTGALKGFQNRFQQRESNSTLLSNTITQIKEQQRQKLSEASSHEVVQSTMHPVTADVLPFLKANEGQIKGLYVDSEGLLTMGIGTLVSTTPVPENVQQWLKQAQYTLNDIEIESLAVIRIDEKRKELQSLDWYQALDPKRKGLVVRLCFWLGTHGFVSRWKKTVEAIEAQDWELTAKELMNSRIGRGEQGIGVKHRMQSIANAFLSQ